MSKQQKYDFSNLRELLENEHEWPCHYHFKFVAKGHNHHHVINILGGEEQVVTRPSRNGNYISISSKTLCQAPDEVIEIYQRVTEIEGVISL